MTAGQPLIADRFAVHIVALAGNGDAGGWLGGPSRLTGEATMPPATHRALVGDDASAAGAGDDFRRGFQWRGRQVSEHRVLPGLARGMVIGLMDIVPEAADEFHDWYETEHMPRLSALPGVLGAARYAALPNQGPAHLALYLMEDLAISQSPAWMAAARTPWSARMRRFNTSYARYSFRRAG